MCHCSHGLRDPLLRYYGRGDLQAIWTTERVPTIRQRAMCAGIVVFINGIISHEFLRYLNSSGFGTSLVSVVGQIMVATCSLVTSRLYAGSSRKVDAVMLGSQLCIPVAPWEWQLRVVQDRMAS